MGYLTGSNITHTVGSEFMISESNGYFMFSNLTQSYDDVDYVQHSCYDLTGSYSTALVVGLGIGVIPQWLATEKNCQVDVLEKNTELVNTINNFDYLSGSINIINEDVFEHTATKSYDIVVPDIWWNQADITPSQKTAIANIFSASAQIEYPLDT